MRLFYLDGTDMKTRIQGLSEDLPAHVRGIKYSQTVAVELALYQ